MAESGVPEDGEPLKFGDFITLYDKQLAAFVSADGFNMASLMYKKEEARDTRCIFQICPKLAYQAQKRYKKVLGNIGIRKYDELESFREQEVSRPASCRQLLPPSLQCSYPRRRTRRRSRRSSLLTAAPRARRTSCRRRRRSSRSCG